MNNKITKNKLLKEKNTGNKDRATILRRVKRARISSLVCKKGGVIIALVLFLGIFFGLQQLIDNSREAEHKKVTIGGVDITRDDVVAYASLINGYQERFPAVDFEGDPEQVAIDDLVLNAALKYEAQELGKSITPEDIQSEYDLDKSTDTGDFLKDIRQNTDFGFMTVTRAENKILKNKLADDIIITKDVFMVGISFDSPYHYQQNRPDDVAALHEEAIRTLREQFLPLMVGGSPINEIASRADVDVNSNRNTQDWEQYFDQLVTVAQYIEGYKDEDVHFTDLEGADYGADISNLVETKEKFNELRVVGDTTDVFSAKSGMHMVLRLESISNGKYVSWQKMLAEYKNEHSAERLLVDAVMAIGRDIAQMYTERMLDLTSVGFKKAQAQSLGSGFCGNHMVTFRARSWDTTANVRIGGTQFSHQRTAHNCGSEFTGTKTRTTSASSDASIVDNCWGPEPNWSLLSHPSGYNFINIRSGENGSHSSGVNYNGWPDWVPATINSAGTIYIHFRYEPSIQPYMVNTHMIRGGFEGGGGPLMDGSISGHAITANGSTTGGASALHSRSNITTVATVRAPETVVRNGVVWDRMGSSRCYDSTDCRSAGVQSDLSQRSFDETDRGRTVYVYWFYRERDVRPDFSLSANCSTITLNNISDPNTAGSLYITVSVGGEAIFSDNRSQGTHTFTYPQSRQNTSSNIVTVTINSYVPPGSPSAGNRTRSVVVPPCYQASCSAATISPAHILAGTNFSTTASFTNTGQLAWPTNGRVTSRIEYTSTQTVSPLPSSTGGGNTLTIGYSPYTARNNTIDRQTVIMRLYLDGSTLLAACTRNFDPYTAFELDPEVIGGQLVGGIENPSAYELDTRVNVSWSPTPGPSPPTAISGPTATRTITRNGSIADTFLSNGVYPRSFTDSTSINNPQAGDEYCGSITVSGVTGWVNRFGSIRNVAGVASDDGGCQTVYDQPYISVFGADVIAAGDFGNADCTGGGVITTNFDRNFFRGSGAQFASFAVSQIQRFSSSKMRAPVNETAFANTGTGVGDYGGSYPGSHCITDFASLRPAAPASTTFTSTAQANTLSSGVYDLSNQNVASGGGIQIPNGKSFTLYRDGDVFIRNNIIYANNTWANIADIPSFYLIVRGGNIYISNDVTNLDGVYIAQPQGGNGGNIYTCASTSMVPYQPQQLFQDCQNELTVNGALIAETVHFNRYGNSSLRYGSQDEYTLGGNRTCGDGVQRPVCAAEIVNFSPELYLSTPQLPVLSAPGQGGYDAIVSLPPIF